MRSRIVGVLTLAALAFAPAMDLSFPAGATVPLALSPGDSVVGIAPTADGQGYWLATAEGAVLAHFGDSVSYGSMAGRHLDAPIAAIAATPDGKGYWLAAADGGVFAFGDAGFYGSMGGTRLDAPVVAIAATADGKGYWLAAADGGVFAFGDAVFGGSDVGLLQPTIGSVSAIAPLPLGPAPDDEHYMLATEGGDVAAFGFSGGSFPGGYRSVNAPYKALAWAGGLGYWIAAADGGVFALGAPDEAANGGYFGSTPFYGSMGGEPLNAPVVGMASTPDHRGYWLVASDGGIFAFGDASFLGSAAG